MEGARATQFGLQGPLNRIHFSHCCVLNVADKEASRNFGVLSHNIVEWDFAWIPSDRRSRVRQRWVLLDPAGELLISLHEV